jgi:UDP-2,4-diacetamido-2,4,6-trideoxy-beta-L-altropyranose hydrolase
VRVGFRFDVNRQIGTGHFHRCANLARELISRNHEVFFLCGQASGAPSFELKLLGATNLVVNDPVRDYSIGGKTISTPHDQVIADARSTVDALGTAGVDAIVLDHYSLSDYWVAVVRERINCRTLVVDDCGRQWPSTNAVVDSALNSSFRYGIRDDDQVGLFGPSFAPLGDAYRDIDFASAKRSIKRQVSIFFGGIDEPNATRLAIDGVIGLNRTDLDVVAVIGDQNPHRDYLRRKYAGSSVRLLEPAGSMHPYLVDASVAVGAGGTTTWERLCMGVPSVVMSISENQIDLSRDLGAGGFHDYLGHVGQVESSRIADAVVRLLDDEDLSQEMSLRGRMLVDGFGTSRICEWLAPSPKSDLILRAARESDRLTLFRWVNDDLVRLGSLSTGAVTWSQHCEWFAAALFSPRRHIFIAEIHGMPVGQLRLDVLDTSVRLSYMVEASQRRRGLGRWLVECGVDWAHTNLGLPVSAEVKASNVASIQIFSRLGFTQLGRSVEGVVSFVSTLKLAEGR